ncbi:MAG: SPOR domain-containing protein [Chitinophagaceae bacterium]
MKIVILIISVLMMKAGLAQETSTPVATQAASVIVHKDPRIDILVKKQASINKTANSKKNYAHTMRGYRLMVINTNKREDAIAAKTKIYTYFPEIKAYLSYQSPYFKLKAGNFKTRAEADRYRKNMNTLFPNGVFIMSDIIEVKADKDEVEEDN